MRLSLSIRTLLVCALPLAVVTIYAQQAPAPPPSPIPPAGPVTGPSSPQASQVQPAPKPVAQDPPIIEDGGISLQVDDWLSSSTPTTRGGSGAYAFYPSDLNFPGKPKYLINGMLSFPAGKQNSLRFSYFRVQGHGETVAPQPGLSLYSVEYAPGDMLNNSYLIQGAKLSWDYLSYTFRNPGRFNGVRFKTLYELQLVSIGSQTDSPNEEALISNGVAAFDTQTSFLASGSKTVILPTFGGELEQQMNKHFRWEVMASGFGIPHHGVIWDGQADIAIRFGKTEVLGGYRGFHFETSSGSADQYYKETLVGAFAGIRYYLLSSPEK